MAKSQLQERALRRMVPWVLAGCMAVANGFGQPPGLDSAVEDLASEDPAIRQIAMASLATMGNDALTTLTYNLKNSEIDRVRSGSAVILLNGGYPHDKLIPEVLPLLAAVDPVAIRETQSTLYRIGRPTLPHLLKSVEEHDMVTMTAASAVLREMGPEALEGVIRLTRHEDGVVREHAVRVLGEFGPKAEPAIPQIVERLTDEESYVRAAAESVLESLPINTTEKLIPLLAHEDPEVRDQVAAVLGRLGPNASAAVPAIIQLTLDGVPEVRARSVDALSRVDPQNGAGAVTAVEPLLRDPEPEVRLAAVRALARMGEYAVGALPALSRLRGEESEELRNTAYDAMGLIADAAAHSKSIASIKSLKDAVETLQSPGATPPPEKVDRLKTAISSLETSEREGRRERAGNWFLEHRFIIGILTLGLGGGLVAMLRWMKAKSPG